MLAGPVRIAVVWAIVCAVVVHSAETEMEPRVLKRVKAATAFIQVRTKTGRGTGSGFLVTRDLLVTNAHVVWMKRGNARVWPKELRAVFHSGQEKRETIVELTPVALDRKRDLAFLRVKWPKAKTFTPPAPLKLAGPENVEETTKVFMLGFPFGRMLARRPGNPSITVSAGSVSSFRKGPDNRLVSIQIDGDLNPGNSGGPIVLKNGDVAAVSVSTVMGTQISFSIPADDVRILMDSGRVSTVITEDTEKTPDGIATTIVAETIDPMDRMQQLVAAWWKGSNHRFRVLDKKTKFPTHGMEGDSKLIYLPLKKERRDRWKTALKGLKISPKETLFVQIMKHDKKTGYTCLSAPQAFSIGSDVEENPRSTTSIIIPFSPIEPPSDFRPPATVKPVVPKGLKILEAREAKDSRGRLYTRLSVTAERVNFKKAVRGWAVPPSGRVIYFIYKGEPGVFAVDPQTFKPLAKIPTPRNPTSIWCDESRVVVACPESKVVTVLDTKKKQPIKAFRLENSPTIVPQTVVGRTPDKDYLILWRRGDRGLRTDLMKHSESGKIQYLLRRRIQWAVAFPDANMLLVQGNFHYVTPHGVIQLIDLKKLNPKDDTSGNLLHGAGFHRSWSIASLTHDGRSVTLSTRKVSGLDQGRPWTYVFDTLLQRPQMGFPGITVAEVPAEAYYVTVGMGWDPITRRAGRGQICYVESATGRVLRQIDIAKMPPDMRFPLKNGPERDFIYVPGHQFLLTVEGTCTFRDGIVAAIRVPCGPVAAKYRRRALPRIVPTNKPPTKIKVKSEFRYTPVFSQPLPIGTSFRLKAPVGDMKVDSKTGALSWTPGEGWIGAHQVTVLAKIGKTEIEVITWTIKVE